MFELLIVKPILNFLVFIYALLPGHNFGLALIIFTILVRLFMWPLVKKQLHHTRAMNSLKPEIKKIKKAANGNRQQESMMLMALYKERQISPFGSIGILIVQLVILIGLYSGLQRLINNPNAIFENTYAWIQNLGWLRELAGNIDLFDSTLFGFVDLTRSALGSEGGIYLPAMVLVLGSATTQYFQSKQLMPTDKNARSLRQILKEAGTGKQADQSEVQAATSKGMSYFIPILIFVFTVGLASALALYWFVGGLVAYIQQSKILGQDKEEMLDIADKTPNGNIIEGEIVSKSPSSKSTSKKKKNKSNKRRR
jgi:YidC/Oxa1 family membrane protein insertase